MESDQELLRRRVTVTTSPTSRYRNQVQYNGFGIGAGWSAPAVWGVEFGAKF